jgi:hypothetical protein
MAVITMSIAQWAEVSDNPRQRDTERRAEFGRRNHLAEYHKTHDYVYAAVLKGDVFCKLDGHTRSYLWSRGDLDPPPSGQVQVLLIDVINKQEAMDIYDELDSIKAFKRVSDRVFGATREHGFRLRSSLLNGCKFGTQIKLAETGTYSGDAWSLIKRWKATLLDLDALNLPKKYPTLISAMLLSIRRDAVQALVHHMDIRKAEGRTAGYENVSDILARAWYAYEAWLDGKRVKRLGCAKIGAVIESIQKERSAKRGSKRSSAN